MEPSSDLPTVDPAAPSPLTAWFAPILSYLDALDLESDEWQLVEKLASTLVVASERRAAELSQLQQARRDTLRLQRSALRQALDQLTALPNLDFYGLGHAHGWSEGDVAADQLEAAIACIHELCVKLESHSQEQLRLLGTFASPEALIRLAGLTEELTRLKTQAGEWFNVFGGGDEISSSLPLPPLPPTDQDRDDDPIGLLAPLDIPNAEDAHPSVTAPVELMAIQLQAENPITVETPQQETGAFDVGAIEQVGRVETTFYINLEFDDIAATEPLPGIDIEQVYRAIKESDNGIPVQSSSLSQSEWEAFSTQLILQGDIAGAYWLARSLEERSEPVALSFPSYLLAAVQGAWWLESAQGALDNDLIQLFYIKRENMSAQEKLVTTAIALLPTLIAPATGAHTWLDTESPSPSLNAITTAVQIVRANHRPIGPEDVRAVYENRQRWARIKELETNARAWQVEAPQIKFAYQPASEVWRAWTKKSGELWKFMNDLLACSLNITEAKVKSNGKRGDEKSERIKSLQKAIAEWRARDHMYWITKKDHELQGKSTQDPITGPSRDGLIDRIEKTIALVEEWLMLTSEIGDPLRGGQELSSLINAVTDRAAAVLPELAATESFDTVHPDVSMLVRWALADLIRFLGLPSEEPGKRQMATFPQGSVGLHDGLQARLLTLPEVGLDQEPGRSPHRLDAVAAMLYHTAQHGRDIGAAVEAHLALLDFRFLNALLLNQPDDERALLQQRCDEERKQAGLSLDYELRNLRRTIEQRYTEALIDDEDRTLLVSELSDLEREAGGNDYGRLLAKLYPIKQFLEERQNEHHALQRQRWEAIRGQLIAQKIIGAAAATVDSYMENALHRGDIVATDERLARLESLLDAGEVLSPDEFVFQEKPDLYREYLATLQDWEPRLSTLNFHALVRQLKMDRIREFLRPDQTLTPARIKEASHAFEKWFTLKSTKTSDQELILESLGAVMHYLGFTFQQAPEASIRWQSNGRQWVYVTMHMTAGGQSPIPQFGSQREGKYNVICIWEQRGLESAIAYLHSLKLSFSEVIVIFLGPLTMDSRLKFMRQARGEKPLSVALLDEVLLLFLLRESGPRVGAFFQCALPLACVNPYSPTGPVFAEMFFGRADQRVELQRGQGSALVFGGRQLGKSALLQQVHRDYHSPENDQYVLRKEIKFVGEPAGGYTASQLIWRHLQFGLQELGILEPGEHTTPEEIAEDIRQMMALHRNRRVLVLFDEADNFLAADMRDQFREVSRLKSLMDDTERRFKVILAGLHNVQRYYGMSNQPLAHMAPLPINPLDPFAAQDLVRRPLESLGFRFPSDDDTPLFSILAYTNYHPGLIQLFCHRLLTLMYRKPVNSLEPMIITLDDVETVFRQAEVQQEIKHRFDWTLDLDERYKALAYMIVLDQLAADRKSNSAHSYDVDTLLEIARAQWPKAFEDTERDTFQVYLEEMVGLGVLFRTGRNSYRLRSPNLIRLMGNEQDIKKRLDAQVRRSPASTLVEDSYHASLGPDINRYSPFTYQQARLLNTRQSGVGLIFGSNALTIDLVPMALENHFLPHDGGRLSGFVSEIDVASGGSSLSGWLDTFLAANAGLDHVIVYCHLRGSYDEMIAAIATAKRYCEGFPQRPQQWMRAFFIFDQRATYEWFRQPAPQRDELERSFGPVVSLRRWDSAGVANLLERQGYVVTDDIVHEVSDLLRGWPSLLDQVNMGHRGSDFRSQVYKRAYDNLLNNVGRSQAFLDAAGWNVDPQATATLLLIAAEQGGVPEDMLVPDVLGVDMSSEQLEAIVNYARRLQLLSLEDNLLRIDKLVGRLVGH